MKDNVLYSAKLRFMTRELNILTGAQECSDDDEDCANTVPEVCRYYEFLDSYDDVIEEEIGSGSGSGDDGVEFVTISEEETACASINSVPNVVVTPIVSGGPTSAVSGNMPTDSGTMKMSSSASTLLTLFLVLVSLAATMSSCKSYL